MWEQIVSWCLLVIVIVFFAMILILLWHLLAIVAACQRVALIYSFHAGMYLVQDCVLLVVCTQPWLQRDIVCALECSSLSIWVKRAGVNRPVVNI